MLSPKTQSRLAELEKRLSLRSEFCLDLLAESDWSFFVKTHALFEAALTRLLAQPKLAIRLARLSMSEKLEFAKSLEYVEKEERRFVSKWSGLRNDLVHDITNTSFDIKAHIALLSDKAIETFCGNFYLKGWHQPDILTPPGLEAAKADPKEFLFLGAMSLLEQWSHYFDWADNEREMEHMNWFLENFGKETDSEEI